MGVKTLGEWFLENGSGSQTVVQMHFQLCYSFSEQRLLVVIVTV